MTHLGSWLSALADGQLPADVTERCLAHVAVCRRCAVELDAARAAHQALAAAAAAEQLEPTPDLTARLLSLAPPSAAVPVHRDPFAPTTSLPGRSSGVLRGDVQARRERIATRITFGGFAGLGLVAIGLFALGAHQPVVPSTHPGQALDILGAASAAPLDESAADVGVLAADGWAVPSLPAGWSVLAAHHVDGGIEVDVTGPAGTAVVSERRGRLDTAALNGQPVAEVGGRDVYLLSSEPWHVAWQCDEAVVEVVAPAADAALDSLIAAFPSAPYDEGVSARISRGWTVVAHAFEMP